MRKIYWLLSFSFASIVSSCQTEKEELNPKEKNQSKQIKIDDINLTVLNSTIWSGNIIEVCWENPSDDDVVQRNWVRDQVRRTWELNSSIAFIGWGKCSAGSRGIRIYIAPNGEDINPHVKGLGSRLDGRRNGMVLDFDWSGSGASERNQRAIAVHEFGHALGFAHEHNTFDCGCPDEDPQGTNGDNLLTPCDISSVMNYCNPTWSNGGLLSNFDIQGIRSLYGPPNIFNHQRWATNQGGFWNEQQWISGDFNGDGKWDLAKAMNNGSGGTNIDIHLTNNSFQFNYQRWATNQGGFWNEQQWVSGDFNGDGKWDLAKTMNDGNGGTNIDVHISNGNGSFSHQRWATNQGGFWNEQQWVSGDFNGDGKWDLAKAMNDGNGGTNIDVHISNGNGSFSHQRWATNQGGFWNEQQWVSGDFDGDGKYDLGASMNDGNGGTNIDVHISNNNGSFSHQRWATNQGGFWNEQQWVSGNFNGDGKFDLAKSMNDGNGGTNIDVHISER